MSLIITGGHGFIGQNLKIFLKKKKIKFSIVDKRYGDLSLKKNWTKIPSGDALIHLASSTGVDKSILNSKKYLNKILRINHNAINFCIKKNMKLIFPSSVIYGPQKKSKFSENLIPKPNNPYLKSKYLSEKLIISMGKKNYLSYVILRIFNVYGPYQNKNFLIPHLLSGLKKKIRIKNLNSSRDYIFIEDVISAIMKAVEYEKNDIFNVGSGKKYKVIDLIKLINKISYANINFTSNEIFNKHEAISVKADITKAIKKLKWKPSINIHDGLKRCISFYEK